MATLRRLCLAAVLAGVALFLTACAGVPASSERVLSFHSGITVQPDGTMAVRETINVRSSGVAIRHGIFREFAGEGADGRFRLEDVLLDGQPAERFTRDVAGNLRLYIGREDQLLPPGEHTYTIAFQTGLGVRTEADLRVLRWNATGDKWSFPIDAASATVELPPSVPRESLKLEAYTGAARVQKPDVDFHVDGQGRVQFQSLRALGIGEGMTVMLSWPGPAEPGGR